MGSMFTTGYRHAIDGQLAGLPAGVAAQAREAPGLALSAAQRLAGTGGGSGGRGEALADAARHAFTSGMRLSMLIGAVLLLGASAYVWFRGPDRDLEVLEDVVDVPVLAEVAP